MAFPLMALGAGLGIAADDINKQRMQQAQLQMQQMKYAAELAQLRMALQKYGQEQQAAQRIGSLTPPPLDGGSGGSQTPGMPPLPNTPGANQSPYASGMSIGGATDPASLVKRYESSGRYNVGFGGTDLSNAPLDQYGFPQWPGAMGPKGISHAAGAYQFQPGTWGPAAAKLSIHDFSPASQDAVFNEVSHGGRDLSAWAPYNQALARALNRSMPSPPRAATPAAPIGASQPTGRPLSNEQFDILQGMIRDGTYHSGANKVEPTATETYDQYVARLKDGSAAQPETQVAQATPPGSQTATDASPQMPQGAQQQLQLPPRPQLVDLPKYEAQLRAQVGADIRTPEGRDYIAKSMAAATAENAMRIKKWEMEKADVEFQATQQQRAEEAKSRGLRFITNNQTGETKEWHPGQPIPKGWKVGAQTQINTSQSTGRERDVEGEIARRDAAFLQKTPGATDAQKQEQHFKNREAVEKELGGATKTPRSAPAMFMQKYEEEHPDATAHELALAASEFRRWQSIESAFGGGVSGRNLISLNTVADHLLLVKKYAEALQNGQIPIANAIANRISQETGGPEVTNFETGRDIMTGEVVRLLTTTGGTEGDRRNFQSRAPANASPQQMFGGLQVFNEFVNGRFRSLEQEYAQNDPQRMSYFEQNMLTPSARQVFEKPGAMQPSTPQTGMPTPQQGAPGGGGAQPPLVDSDEAYKALPPGASFRAPDGQTYKKP